MTNKYKRLKEKLKIKNGNGGIDDSRRRSNNDSDEEVDESFGPEGRRIFNLLGENEKDSQKDSQTNHNNVNVNDPTNKLDFDNLTLEVTKGN